MKSIPFIKNPTISDILKYKEQIPCFDRVERIINEEVEKGNHILCISDIGTTSSETFVVIDFASEAKCDYAQTKVAKWGGCEYRYLALCDNKGAVEFDFGRIKE